VAESPQQVAEALEAWLRGRGTEATVDTRGRATVGLSQDTWFVDITSEEAAVEAVLRLPTPASGTRAILTQRAALQAVAGSVPAPRLLWHDDGADNPFSRPFLVMERVAGEVPVGWHELEEPRRTRLGEHAMDVLAALHRADPSPLAPPDRGTSAGPTELAWYRRRLERLAPLPAVLGAALWWLGRHEPPPPERTVLVHGDYRMGNMIVNDDRITGVLDWEMAAPGDPLADLTWCFIPLWELPGLDEPSLVRRYAQHRRAEIDEERFHWFRVLGYVRLAYYALAGTRAFDSGRSDDFRLAALRLQLPVHLDRLAATLVGEQVE
jgi:aminoglycoside phosphotransferase (APT) family kinase protein